MADDHAERDGRNDAGRTRDGEEARKPRPAAPPPAGPHADPRLTNEDATPGTGSLPDHRQDGDADPAGG